MQDDAKSVSIAERKGRCRDEKVGKQGRRNALAMNIVNHLIKHTHWPSLPTHAFPPHTRNGIVSYPTRKAC
jgi:hypothetical protein